MNRTRARLGMGAAAILALGGILRLRFITHNFFMAGDTMLYGDIALSWMQHGVYGFAQPPLDPLPTLIRLPGYPLFLMLCFRLFGLEHYRAVVNTQAILDLLACLLLAALARRLFGLRSAVVALALGALCPFSASYVAAPIAETLTLASITVTFYALERWRSSLLPATPVHLTTPWNRWLWLISAGLAYSLLLRPDQGFLAAAVLPAVLWITRRATPGHNLRQSVAPALAAGLCTLLPLVPWTIRNERTFHVFQPLAPRSADDPGEAEPSGFNHWYRTWGLDFTSTEDVYWKYDGAQIQLADLPSRAFDSPEQLAETASVLNDYNLTAKPSPELEARFNGLAEQRIRASPLRYYFVLPVARLLDMLLRPRTEMLPVALAWWRIREHPGQTALALFYGAINLAYLIFGGMGLRRWIARKHDPTRVVAWAMLAYIALRCALLLTLDNSEPRYTLEFFPILILGASALFARRADSPTAGQTSSSCPS